MGRREIKLKIFKYVIEDRRQMISLPKGAVILSLQNQREAICFWALIDPEAETERRIFHVVGTGHEIGQEFLDNSNYIGSLQQQGGLYVWHIYEEVRGE